MGRWVPQQWKCWLVVCGRDAHSGEWRVLQKVPVVCLTFETFRLIFLLNIVGFSVCPASLGERPLSPSPSKAKRMNPMSQDYVQGCDCGPSKQIMTRTFTRSTGKKVLSFNCDSELGRRWAWGSWRCSLPSQGDTLPENDASIEESRAKSQSKDFMMTLEDLDPALPEASLCFLVTEADKVHFFPLYGQGDLGFYHLCLKRPLLRHWGTLHTWTHI